MPARVGKREAIFACIAIGVSLAAVLRFNARAKRKTTGFLDAQASIARAMSSLIEALHRADPHAYAEHFADDALSMPAVGPVVRGRVAIESAMERTFEELRFVKAEMASLSTKIDGNYVVEAGDYRYVVALAENGDTRTLTGRYAIGWKRDGEGWKIALDVGQAAQAKE